LRRCILSQSFAPFQSFTNFRHTPPRFSHHATRGSSTSLYVSSSEVLAPAAFSQILGATHLARPTATSTYILRVSHPLDVLLPEHSVGPISSRSRSWGSPFKALLLTVEPYVLSNAATSMALPAYGVRTSHLRGLTHNVNPARRAWLFTALAYECLPGFDSFKVSFPTV
jgi:hypothetical protein